MKKRMFLMPAVFCALSLSAGTALAADPVPVQKEVHGQRQEQIYGSQLMTEQERAEYQARIRTAKTPRKRAKIRQEHHQAMLERARARGITLPDEPPASGGGVSPGGGMGPGGGRGR